MEIKKLAADISVSAQTMPGDIAAIAEAAFKWLIDGAKPSALDWYLKGRILPPLYRDAMLKGREWLAKPEMVG